MSGTISANSPILQNLVNTLDQSGGADVASDVVSLINDSPTLVAELNALSANDPSATIAFSANGSSDTQTGSGTLDVIRPTSNSDQAIVTSGGSETQQSDNITPSGEIVGDLARSLAKSGDFPMGYLDAGSYGLFTVERFIATEFLDRAKQDLLNISVKAEIEAKTTASPLPSMATPYILYNDGSGPAGSTLEIKQVNAYAATPSTAYTNDLAFLGAETFSTPAGKQILSQAASLAGSSSGPVNPDQIDIAAITNVAITTDASGNLASSAITVDDPNYGVLTYNSTYSNGYQETTTVTAASGTYIPTISWDTSNLAATGYALETITEGNIGAIEPTNAALTVIGTGNYITATGPEVVSARGDMNTVTYEYGASITVNGNHNDITPGPPEGIPVSPHLLVSLSGDGNLVVVENSTAANITGTATGTRVFGGNGNLDYSAGAGTVVLDGGNAVIDDSDGNGKLDVFGGGSGTIHYAGGADYSDVIAGATGHDTISAGAQGGWFEGGSGGFNLINGGIGGAGTVLQAGGNGDTITGGANGGSYILAGAGNETLIGGNSAGTTVFFGASGADDLELGAANSIVDLGTGGTTVSGGGGSAQFYIAGGAPNLFLGVNNVGSMAISGFRAGTDHINPQGRGTHVAVIGSNTVINFNGGGTMTLYGVTNTQHLFG